MTADHKFDDGWRGTVGAQYVDIDFEALGDEAFVPRSKTKSTSLFAFEERHFDRWTIELGARAEQQKIDVDPAADLPDFDETAVSLSAGTVWKFAEDRALALNVTRTQRNPQAAELYANGRTSPISGSLSATPVSTRKPRLPAMCHRAVPATASDGR